MTQSEVQAFRDEVQRYLDRIGPKLRGLERNLLLERAEGQGSSVGILQKGIEDFGELQGVAQGVRDGINTLLRKGFPGEPKVRIDPDVLKDLRENSEEIKASLEVFETDPAVVGGEVRINERS